MLGVATGRFPIRRRVATCPTILRWAFIPCGGPKAHEDSQDWLPRIAANRKLVLAFVSDARRPINNRPQVTNLPHKIFAAPKKGMDSSTKKRICNPPHVNKLPTLS